jgi:hypothetical protein
MEFTGRVKNGAVVLDDAKDLPEGARIRIVVLEEERSATPLGKALLQFAGRAEGLPEDFAENHDHYIHGCPKK